MRHDWKTDYARRLAKGPKRVPDELADGRKAMRLLKRIVLSENMAEVAEATSESQAWLKGKTK